MAAYRVVLTPAAERQFAKLSHQSREMVAAALVRSPEPLALHGASSSRAPKTSGRLRVRQYRVIYQIQDDRLIVTVVKIGDRKDVYR